MRPRSAPRTRSRASSPTSARPSLRGGSAKPKLFQSEGWAAYEGRSPISRASEGAEQEIEAHFTRQMESHRSAIAQQQERVATATSGQAGLASKEDASHRRAVAAQSRTAGAGGGVCRQEERARCARQEIDAKRVEAMAEDKGVEGSLKAGKGPDLPRALGGDEPPARVLQDRRGARA